MYVTDIIKKDIGQKVTNADWNDTCRQHKKWTFWALFTFSETSYDSVYQICDVEKYSDNPICCGSSYQAVNWRSALTCWLTLAVRAGLLHTHPPKWSPHVANVKYSSALISLAPAMFLFAQPPHPQLIPRRVHTCHSSSTSSSSPYDLIPHLQGLNGI